DRLRATVLAAGEGHPQLRVEETGDVSASDARDRVVNRDLNRAEILSVPVTLLVLLFAFGPVVAALVPVLLALTAVAAAFGLLGPRIARGRIPFLPHLRTETADSRFWPAVVDRVLRRPILSCALAAGLLVALVVPAFSLHVSKPSDESLSSQNEPALATLAR